MKIAHLNYSDYQGGAARATYRIHYALRQQNIDSVVYVAQSDTGDWTVRRPGQQGMMRKTWHVLRPFIEEKITAQLKTANPILHSSAALTSFWTEYLNNLEVDIIHFQWLGNLVSIRAISRISKPLVWTLHDMWPFCGAEHYAEDFRWRDGYTRRNRPNYESGFDLNRWVWRRKNRNWRQPMHIVTPSLWLADCVRESALMRDWPVTVVPNALDTDVWRPLDKQQARELLGLPQDVLILLFGAMGGGCDPRKGFDLLKSALRHLRGEIEELHLVVFGQRAPKQPLDLGFPVRYTGHLHDDLSLRVLYSAADVLVNPSRLEAFGQTASEAHACGTSVVAFNNSGLSDIVTHLQTGYLARAFDTEDLASGIQWVLADRARHAVLRANARRQAVARFAYPVVAAQYLKVYQAALSASLA